MVYELVYVMKGCLGKVVPPKREILKDIWLSFFLGAKVGGRHTDLAFEGDFKTVWFEGSYEDCENDRRAAYATRPTSHTGSRTSHSREADGPVS